MLSILIPSYYKEELLFYGLSSLEKQQKDFDFETLVLNDGIDDNTQAICRQFPSLKIRYIFTGQRNKLSPKWRCPGFVLNIAVKQSKGEYILIQQPEIYYETSTCIKEMMRACYSVKDVISPQVALDNGEFLSALRAGRVISVSNSLETQDSALPWCMLMHKSEFEEIGGYDEDFVGYCFDDNDFSDRLKANCCKLVTLEDQRVIHLFHPRSPQYRVGLSERNKSWQANREMYEARKGIIMRNVGRVWGALYDH